MLGSRGPDQPSCLPGRTHLLLPSHHEMRAVLCTRQGGRPGRLNISLPVTQLERRCFPLEGTEKPSVGEFLLPCGRKLVNKFRSGVENKMMAILGGAQLNYIFT